MFLYYYYYYHKLRGHAYFWNNSKKKKNLNQDDHSSIRSNKRKWFFFLLNYSSRIPYIYITYYCNCEFLFPRFFSDVEDPSGFRQRYVCVSSLILACKKKTDAGRQSNRVRKCSNRRFIFRRTQEFRKCFQNQSSDNFLFQNKKKKIPPRRKFENVFLWRSLKRFFFCNFFSKDSYIFYKAVTFPHSIRAEFS